MNTDQIWMEVVNEWVAYVPYSAAKTPSLLVAKTLSPSQTLRSEKTPLSYFNPCLKSDSYMSQAERVPKGCTHTSQQQKTTKNTLISFPFWVFLTYTCFCCLWFHHPSFWWARHCKHTVAAEETNGPYCSKLRTVSWTHGHKCNTVQLKCYFGGISMSATFWPVSGFELSKKYHLPF